MDKTSEKERINEMVKATMKVARGDYSVQVELSGENDEFDSLAMGLNMMIDDIRTNEETLRESEEKYRGLVNTSIDGVVSVDRQMKIIIWNRGAERIFGYTENEMRGQNLMRILPERYREAMEKGLAIFVRTGSGPIIGKVLELAGLRKEGTEVPIELSVSSSKAGETHIATAMIRDITGRKKIEDALMESEERFRIASQIASDVVYERDLQTGIATFYGDIESHLGYEPGGYPRTMEGWREHVHPEDLARIESQPMDQIQPGVPYGIEYRMKKKDGTYMTWSDRIMMVWDEKAGKPLKFIGAATDITKRKRMEQELRATNEELQAAKEELEDRVKERTAKLEVANKELRETQEQLIRSEKLAAIGQLAGGVGHELRNPLGAIKNAVYYVRGKVAKSELGQKEPRVLQFLEIIDEEIDSSNKIINDLLGFSRVGKPAVSPARIEKVIEDALSRTPIPENIELTKKLDADLPEVEIDPDQIQQVLINMITNAVQAMPEGGKLTIGAREEGKFLEVEIADAGVGIPQEVRDKIFEPLFTTKAKGIGLGLAVCKSIIDRHEGNIEVESEVGKGTTVNIKLPLKAA